jgi:hypothetical protein
MTFCTAVSSSAGAFAVVSGAVFASATVGSSITGDSGDAAFAGRVGFGGVGGVSSEARMREIGGKTVRFGFISPSSVFLLGFFRSMSETLSASRLEGRALSAAGFDTGAVRGFVAGATSAFSFCFGSFVLAAAAGLRAAGVPRADGLRVAVLLLVFVAIVVRLKFCSWPELP